MWYLGLWNWLVGRIWKSLEKWAKKGLNCYKQSLMGNSGGSSGDQKADRMNRAKGRFVRFLLGIGLEAMCVTF
jgi:hypothetical protein